MQKNGSWKKCLQYSRIPSLLSRILATHWSQVIQKDTMDRVEDLTSVLSVIARWAPLLYTMILHYVKRFYKTSATSCSLDNKMPSPSEDHNRLGAYCGNICHNGLICLAYMMYFLSHPTYYSWWVMLQAICLLFTITLRNFKMVSFWYTYWWKEAGRCAFLALHHLKFMTTRHTLFPCIIQLWSSKRVEPLQVKQHQRRASLCGVHSTSTLNFWIQMVVDHLDGELFGLLSLWAARLISCSRSVFSRPSVCLSGKTVSDVCTRS